MPWTFDSTRPIYIQLAEILELKILAGEYAPGDKLPTVRDVASEATVNPNTMQKAFSELERKGLVYTQRTAGRFITEDTALIQQFKQAQAKQEVTQFLQDMSKLGFSTQDCITQLQQISVQQEG